MKFPPFLFLGCVLLFVSSCVSHEELVNFNEQVIPYGQTESLDNAFRMKIQPDDLLRVTVSSFDPEAALPFNIQESVPGFGQVNPTTIELFQGYLVDREGNIEIPVIGSMKVEGLTLEQMKDEVRQRLEKYLKDPVVTARYLNFKVTVLGEVATPGVVRLSNTRVTVLDALGLAGDMTNYANRSEVTVVREVGDQRTYERLNLRRKDVFESPFFYLKQNDVVYVQPIRARVATVADPGQRIVSYGTALLSVVTFVILLTR